LAVFAIVHLHCQKSKASSLRQRQEEREFVLIGRFGESISDHQDNSGIVRPKWSDHLGELRQTLVAGANLSAPRDAKLTFVVESLAREGLRVVGEKSVAW